jgi:hypothetical protein
VCHILDSIDGKILVWGPLGAKSLPETLKANKTKQNKTKTTWGHGKSGEALA